MENGQIVKLEESKALQRTEEKPFNNEFEIGKMLHTVGSLEFGEKECKILYEAIDPGELDIRLDGIVYLPWIFAARRLRNAFPGSWALLPEGKPQISPDNKVMWGFHFIIKKVLIDYVISEHPYFPNNKKQSYVDAVKSVKSKAFIQACKGIGMFPELWDRKYCAQWKDKYTYSKKETSSKGHEVINWYTKDGSKKYLYLKLIYYLFELLDMSEKTFLKKKGKVSLDLCEEEQLKKYKEELESKIKAKFYPKEVKKKIIKSKARNDLIIKINKLVKNKADLIVKLMPFNISDINKATEQELKIILKSLTSPHDKKSVKKEKPEVSLEDLMNSAEKIAKEKGVSTSALNDLTTKICGSNVNKVNIQKLIKYLKSIEVKNENKKNN